jgi:heme o synthase
VIGWVAVTGHVGLEPLVLFLIIFLLDATALLGAVAQSGRRICACWRADIAGRCWQAETKRQILLYCLALVRISLLPWVLGFAGSFYGFAAAMLGRTMVFLSFQLCRSSDEDRRPARRLFVFSMLYPSLTFAVLFMNGALPTRLGRNDGRLAILLFLAWIPSFSRYNKAESLNDFVKFYCARTTCLSAQ